MALTRWEDFGHRWDPIWRDRFSRDWDDWPLDWPRPREVFDRFGRDSDRWWRDWPSDWPRMDVMMPRFSSHLDRFDRNWRNDPFWRDLYPRWAEPIFKEGIDVKTNIVNDRSRFAVDIDAYQFRPEELQVKTLDDTLLIEGRHEDVRDRDNYTKMYFVRKYQLPADVDPADIQSSVDSHGRLQVEARKRNAYLEGRERSIPIEGPSHYKRVGSRSSSYSPRDGGYDSGRGSGEGYRAGYDSQFLSPQSNGYSKEYSNREDTANGMRHERHREQFREEVRRTGSATDLGQSFPRMELPKLDPLPPMSDPFERSESRASRRREERYHRSSSRSGTYHNGGEYRVEAPLSVHRSGTSDHLLRPAEELGGAGGGASREYDRRERSVRIERQAYS